MSEVVQEMLFPSVNIYSKSIQFILAYESEYPANSPPCFGSKQKQIKDRINIYLNMTLQICGA